MRTIAMGVVSAAILIGHVVAVAAIPLGSALTYQGQLKQDGVPVNDTVDLHFRLLADPAGAEPVAGAELQRDAVEVVNGLFTVDLEFGAAAFNGEARWLEVSVRAPHDPTDSGAFTPLTPNAPITPTPYALQTRGIHVSQTGKVGIGPGPFVNDANLQLGIDPVANTVFGGTNLQIGDNFAAQLVLGNGASTYMQHMSGTFGNRISSVGSVGLDLQTGSTAADVQSRMFLSPSGNVGIGTASPGARLDIAPVPSGPTMQIPGTLTVGRSNVLGEDRPFMGIGRSTPLVGTDALTIEIPTTDNQPFGGMYINANSAHGLPFYGYVSGGGFGWTYLNGFDGSWRLNVAGTDWMTVTSLGKFALGGPFGPPNNTLTVFGTTDVQGSVGIGTPTPNQKLEVVAASNGDGIRVTGSNTSGTKSPGVHLYDSTTQRGTLGLAEAANAFSTDAEIGDIVLRANTGKLLLQTGTAASGMSITADGVGIGVANPSTPLQIAGDVRADGGVGYSARNPNNVGGIAIFGWLNDVARLRVGGSDPGGSNGIDIQTLGDRSLMRLLNNGNVGIGTTTPETLLHLFKGDAGMASNGSNTLLTLEDDAAHFVRLMVPNATETGVTFGNPTNGVSAAGIIFDGIVPNGLSFRTGTNDTQMVIDSSGRLGLGTTAPSVKAEIVANGTALRLTSTNDDLPFLDLKAGTTVGPDTGGIRFMDSANTILWQVRADTFGEFSIRSGTTSRMRIDPAGDNSEIRSGLTVDTLTVPTSFGILNVNSPTPGRLIRFNDTVDDNLAIISEIGSITYSGSTVSYNAFTGSHYAWSSESFEEDTLVSLTGVSRRTREDGSGEPIYGISKTVKPNDPAVLGAYSQRLDIGGGSDTHFVSSVGNGDLCIVDRGGGDIEPGDYLISSDIAGCAMKDDTARFAVGHVVARAAERVRWSSIPADPQGHQKTKVSVLFDQFSRGADQTALLQRIERLEAELYRNKIAKLEESK